MRDMPDQTCRGLQPIFRLVFGWGSGAITPGRALAAIILLGSLFHLAWGAALETSNDEAYCYVLTTHPDLSYFDHPPIMAWVAQAGILLCGGWVHPLSLRLGFILLLAGSTFVLARWTSRWFGPWAGVFAAGLLNVSGYQVAAGGFALPDVPYLFFGLLTMWALSEALVARPGQLRPWLWVGLAFGAAFLSKYYAVFLPAAAILYILVTPGTRRLLLSPGPYLAVVIGMSIFSPVLVWNATHGWASFCYQGGRAIGSGFRPENLLSSVFGGVLYLLPWVWYLLVVSLVSGLRRFRGAPGIERLALCLSVVPLALFITVSCFAWTLVHWPLVGFIPLYPLAGAKLAEEAAAAPQGVRRLAAFMAVAVLACAMVGLAQARFGVIQLPIKDPMTEIGGWESVADQLTARGFVGKPRTFLFATKYFESAQLAFSTRLCSPVLCYNPGDARGFAFFSKPEQWTGWDGYLVTTEADDTWQAAVFEPYFSQVKKVAEFPMTRGGRPFRPVSVWYCAKQTRPFAFDQITRKSGILKGDLSAKEIATKVVREFFEAMIAQDYDKAGLLNSGMPADKMREMFGSFKFYRIVEVGKPTPYAPYHSLKVPVKVELGIPSQPETEVHRFSPFVRPVYGLPDRWEICGGIQRTALQKTSLSLNRQLSTAHVTD